MIRIILRIFSHLHIVQVIHKAAGKRAKAEIVFLLSKESNYDLLDPGKMLGFSQRRYEVQERM